MEFNPLHPNAAIVRERLARFHEIVARSGNRYFPTLVINDGAIAYRDLSFRTPAVTFDFIKRSWALLCDINADERANSLPGARMVVAAGFRIRGSKRGIDATSDQFRSLLKRLDAGVITERQAIYEARRIRPHFDVVPQLAANFAFTKAYVAEQSGSKAGLPGPNMFIDLALVEPGKDAWIDLGAPVHWSNEKPKLSADFAVVNDIRPSAKSPAPPGVRNGRQVAEHLTGDAKVIQALRTAA